MAKQEKILHIKVLEGRNLIALDRRGTSDPYVDITVGSSRKKTEVIKKTINPNWVEVEPEPFKFPIDPHNPPSEIIFEIFDWNKFASHKRMGYVRVATDELYEDGRLIGSVEKWYTVLRVKETDNVNGELKVSVSFGEFTGADQLFSAIKKSDLRRVSELLELNERRGQEIDVNAKDEFGYTPLHAACCIFSDVDDQILSLLLHHDAINVTVENNDQNTPLHYFCEKFRSPNCTEAFEIFIKKGADVNAQNKNLESPLHKAIFNNSVRILMVNLLIKNKADVNKVTKFNETPLHYAVHLGREDLVSILLKAGADITTKGRDGRTPGELAQKEGHQKIASLIEKAKQVYDWLDTIGGLDQYKAVFIQQDITKDLLPRLEEKDLDRMHVTTAGHRLKLMKAVKTLRESQGITETAPAAASKKEAETKEVATPAAPRVPTEGNSDLQQELERLMKYSNREGICNLHHSELEFTVKLGAGAAGVVYKGLYKSEEVAIKVLKTEQAQKELEEFKKEFAIMGAVQSPYIVFFFGACLSPKLCMVMEFCSRGSLYDVMNDKTLDLGWDHLFSFSKEMILGMDYLHGWTPQIVHRDFKSLNLMVNEQFHVKVGDFGLSRFNTETQKETLAKMRGTFAYCAPEVYFGNKFSIKSDVFSIGVVLWELATRILKNVYERPYQEFPNLRFDFQIIIQTAKNKVRPTIKDTCPESFATLIRQCWSHEDEERPTCKQILTSLEAIEKEYLANKETWEAARDPKPEN